MPNPTPNQVKALYARLDAAVFYCSTKKASFGLHAYVAHVSQMQLTKKTIWGDLEQLGREEELRNLIIIDHFLSQGPKSERHFLVSQPRTVGSRGQVLAAGSRDEANKRLVEDKKVTLQRALRKAKAELQKAEAALRSFEEEEAAAPGSTAAAPAPATEAGGRATGSRAAGSRAAASRAASQSASDPVAAAKQKPRKRRRAGAADASDDEESMDEDDEDDEEDDEEDEEEGGGSNAQRKRSCPRRQASVEAQARDTFAEKDDEED